MKTKILSRVLFLIIKAKNDSAGYLVLSTQSGYPGTRFWQEKSGVFLAGKNWGPNFCRKSKKVLWNRVLLAVKS